MTSIVSRKTALGIAVAIMVAMPGSAFAADALKGMIVSHDGSTIVVRSSSGDKPVVLTDATKVRGTEGSLNIRGDQHPPTDLIRGLAVEVTTAPDGTASEVTFRKEDLKTARQISAGLASTDARVAENSARIDNVGELVAKGRINVYFASGSATISDKGKKDLQAIATQAKAVTGYRLAVVGRADTTGNAAANQRLSERRAAAVSDYLVKNAGITPGRIFDPVAVGASQVADDPNPPKTAQEARRVTVTIAVSKAAAGN